MTGIRTLEENIARLEEATERADAATRDARAALKDLEHKRREVVRLLSTDAPVLVETAINGAVAQGLDDLSEQFQQASRETYDRVIAQVDVILNIALGKPGSTRTGHADLRPELAQMIREWVVDRVAQSTAEVGPQPTGKRSTRRPGVRRELGD